MGDGPLGVGVHDGIGPAPDLLADDRLMVALYDDLLRQGLFRSGLRFVVVAVGPLVEGIADHIADRFAGPLPSPLRFHAVCREVIGHLQGALQGNIPVEDVTHDLGLFRVHNGVFLLLAPFIPDGYGSSIPEAFFGPGEHDGCDSLPGHLPLQLREHQHDPGHRLSHSGGGIELLHLRDEGAVVLLELFIHLREVQKVSADPVDLVDYQVGELVVPDTAHHLLELRPGGVLCRVPGVLEDFIVLDVQGVLDVVDELFLLEGQAVLVHLIPGGDPDVDGRLQFPRHDLRGPEPPRPRIQKLLVAPSLLRHIKPSGNNFATIQRTVRSENA